LDTEDTGPAAAETTSNATQGGSAGGSAGVPTRRWQDTPYVGAVRRAFEPIARALHIRVQDLGALVALVLLCIVFGALAPGFRTTDNLVTVSRQVSINAIVGSGMTFVIITAGIDLSVGSLVAVSGVLVAGFITNQHMSAGAAVFLALVALGGLGAVNGLGVAKQGLQPFIMTLAMFAAARGIAEVYTGGSVITVSDQNFLQIGTGYVGPSWFSVPIPVVIAAVVLLIAHILLSRTKFGRYVYAIGGNQEAARVSGIPVARVKASVYIISGVCAGIGGIIEAARLFSGDPQAGLGLELDVIAAVVIGGTSLFGGIGNIRGTIIGSFIIGVISNGLTILNVQSFWQDVAKGVVIYAAMSIDTWLRRYRT
jgi:ribose transport system permease protein